jgi:hypothetical protein
VANELGITIHEKNFQLNRQTLINRINELIQSDFQQLILVLYRVDVNEDKLRYLLKENSEENAAIIIADLLIERQSQKIISRQQFNKRDNEIDENEKW